MKESYESTTVTHISSAAQSWIVNHPVNSDCARPGNTYTQVTAAQHANTSTDYVQLYYAKNVPGGATTVTVTFSVTGDKNVGIYEYSGLAVVC